MMRAFAVAIAFVLVAGCNDDNANRQNLPIGNACTTSGQCGTGKFFCDTGRPGGYCKADCHADGDCPTGSVCVGGGMILLGECEKACPNGDGDCRTSEHYVCTTMASSASAPYCDVPPPPAPDGGM